MEGGRDYVMAKLGETIHPMKESFIVAYLMWDGVEEENTVVPKEILEYQQKHGIVVRNRKKQEVKMKEKNDTSSIVPPKTLSISTGSLPITTRSLKNAAIFKKMALIKFLMMSIPQKHLPLINKY